MPSKYGNAAFYNSTAWKKVSRAYMQSKFYLCERCGRPATICHHRTYLNDVNVRDPEIALSFDNLEALCLDCHNREHMRALSVSQFDSSGSVIGVKPGREERDFLDERAKLDDLIEKLKKNDAREAV